MPEVELIIIPVGEAQLESSGGDKKLTGGPGGGDADMNPKPEKDDAVDFTNALATLKAARRKLLAKYATNCSGFTKEYAKLYAKLFNVPEAKLPDLQANALVKHLADPARFTPVDGRTASAIANAGGICFSALAGRPKDPAKPNENLGPGHVMIVVEGPGLVIENTYYPNVMGGGSEGGYSDGSLTAGKTYPKDRRKKVQYYIPRSKPAPTPKPPKPEKPPEK